MIIINEICLRSVPARFNKEPVKQLFYWFDFSDLEGLKTTAVRSAYSDPNQPPDVCYLKSDVEKK